MEQNKLKQMKASEVHRIMATVLATAEKASFSASADVNIQEVGQDHWKMVFTKKSTTLDELTNLRKELGQNFQVNVAPKDKAMLQISIEAPSSDFAALLQKS